MEPYVRDINLLTSTTGLNFLLCSFGDDLSIGISTAYSNPDVVKNFVRYFSGCGIEGRININKTSEEVAEDRLEAKLEASVRRLGGQAPAHGEAETQEKPKRKAKAMRLAEAEHATGTDPSQRQGAGPTRAATERRGPHARLTQAATERRGGRRPGNEAMREVRRVVHGRP